MNQYPKYELNDNTETRIAKCIQFELEHRGNYKACARAVLRDIKLGYIQFDNIYNENDNKS